MKKVLLVATVQSHICQFHKPLVELLHEYGYEVHVAAKDNLLEKNGLKLDFVDQVYNMDFDRSPFKMQNVKAYKKLKKIIEEEQYDIVHCNTPVGGVVGRLASLKSRKKGTKVFYTAHGFHFYKGAPLKNWIIYYPIEFSLSVITDKLITINYEDYNLAKKKMLCDVYHIHGVGVDEKHFCTINQVRKDSLKHKLGLDIDKRYILCVGELLDNKNQQMIICAMPKVLEYDPKIMLLLAGNGPKYDELQKLISSLNLENNVKLIGYVTNINEYHKISDLLVSCSVREGLGLNVIESLMVGNPVVLTDNRGHRELINDSRNGHLLPINDIDGMSQSIMDILSNEEDYTLFSKNSTIFADVYSSKEVKRELKDIYKL